jgi:hypothetical protein
MNAHDLNKTQSARNSKHVFTMLITQFEILEAFQICVSNSCINCSNGSLYGILLLFNWLKSFKIIV